MRIEQTMLRLKIPVKPPLPSVEEMAADEYDGSMSIEEWQSLPRSTRESSFVRFAMAAGLAGLEPGGERVLALWRLSRATRHVFIVPSAGERREFTLPEGLRITWMLIRF